MKEMLRKVWVGRYMWAWRRVMRDEARRHDRRSLNTRLMRMNLILQITLLQICQWRNLGLSWLWDFSKATQPGNGRVRRISILLTLGPVPFHNLVLPLRESGSGRVGMDVLHFGIIRKQDCTPCPNIPPYLQAEVSRDSRSWGSRHTFRLEDTPWSSAIVGAALLCHMWDSVLATLHI